MRAGRSLGFAGLAIALVAVEYFASVAMAPGHEEEGLRMFRAFLATVRIGTIG